MLSQQFLIKNQAQLCYFLENKRILASDSGLCLDFTPSRGAPLFKSLGEVFRTLASRADANGTCAKTGSRAFPALACCL